MKIELEFEKELTEQQCNGIEAIINGNGNLLFDAKAGTGKTFLIVKAVAAINKYLKGSIRPPQILYITFSKALQLEAEEKLAAFKNITVKTYHGLAYMPSKNYYCSRGRANIGDSALNSIINQSIDPELFNPWKVSDPLKKAEAKERRDALISLIHMAKVNLTDYNDPDEVRELALYYSIQLNWDFENIYPAFVICMNRSERQSNDYTFDDMMWIMHRANIQPDKKYDFVIVDEFQDSSEAAFDLIGRFVKPKGRIIAVGDPFQAIQTFAGARINAMDIGRERFNMESMPLSVNFRCGKRIIEWAQQVVPGIQYHPNAIDGNIEDWDYNKLYNLDDRDNNMIICRTNRPLIVPALRFIRMGKKATIKGRDVSSSLINILKDASKYSHDYKEAVNYMQDKLDKELEKYRILEERGMDMSSKTDLISEQYGIAIDATTEEESPILACDKIQSIFTDKATDGIQLSSMHRSKGLEANNVIILESNMMRMPSRPTDPEWHAQGEANIDYVARTRSRENVFLIAGKNKKKDMDEIINEARDEYEKEYNEQYDDFDLLDPYAMK